VGDTVHLRKQGADMGFTVRRRHILIGTDPWSPDPQAQMGLTVAGDPPPGFQPQDRRNGPTPRPNQEWP